MSIVLITFQNVHLVIKADKLLRQRQFICKIVPVPEHISSECGMCIETNIANLQQLQQLLRGHRMEHTVHI
ncbi:DUF3343 domain-containing protein [Geofilum rubicundum]|uniref:Putative Se/S carrier protein-like domain-containing protein n=1 Tax=Geofilum rubicundum JCM 15548 TaxID=1236989 RepID=A0A0E9LZK1_9BACT|nr:DUF3343 domain-containing protein [Geofilum rubicundum]GAO30300.1 hypothetical protein JCM15548_12562 [Geofilum rubicundum JCM 15548]